MDTYILNYTASEYCTCGPNYMASHFGTYKISYSKYCNPNVHVPQKLICENKTLVMEVIIFVMGICAILNLIQKLNRFTVGILFVTYFKVLCIHDLSSIYRVPILLESQGVLEFLNDRLQLNIPMPPPRKFMSKWKDLAERFVS